MGLFNFFKKGNQSNTSKTHDTLSGPAFLEGFTDPILDTPYLDTKVWRCQLKTASGQAKFKIKFYGKLHENLIVGTDFAPSLVFAIDQSTGREILLFDGCKHGYNAMFCDSYTEEQINTRPAVNLYKDKSGEDTFQIIITATYNNAIFLEEELSDQIGEDGLIELVDGSKLEIDIVKRNSFDAFQVSAINVSGKTVHIVSEELA